MLFFENKYHNFKGKTGKKCVCILLITENIIQLNPGDSLEKAKQLFKKRHIRHCGKIAGIFSYTDLQKTGDTGITDEEQLFQSSATDSYWNK